MTRVIRGKITGIEFRTNGDISEINRSLVNDVSVQTGQEEPGIFYSFGAITGTVDTLSRRKGLTFTLYDEVFDRAVICYVSQDQQEQIRDIWGKRVRIIGFIHRELETGRASKVKNIQKIEILSKEKNKNYHHARGTVVWEPNDEPAEKIIRRLRDAS